MCEHGQHHGRHDCGCEHGRHHGRHDCGCERQNPQDCNCHEEQTAEDCGCGHGHQRHDHPRTCCGGGQFHRRFQTRAEQIAVLEAYLHDVQAEVQAVEERIAELKAAG